MIGLIRPDSGRIYFQECEVVPAAVLALRQKMGYVIQEGGLFPHLTVRANVTLMARYLKWDRGRIERRLRELAEITRFPLEGLGRFAAQLSGGERQRVSLMRALMLDPDVLLLDEPLGALDPMIRADLQTDLKRIFQTLRKTVVLVTHDIGEAAFFGDLIVLLHNGRIVQEGTLEELFRAPAEPFVTSFINAQRTPWIRLAGGMR
jgi:osmoprotectant transport system ATP-binding protein